MPENRILVVRGGAIGDFILTLPVLAALRERFPSSRIDVLGYPRIASLAQWGGWADGIRSIEDRPMVRFFARPTSLDPEWVDYMGRCAIVLSYLFDPDAIFRENVLSCAPGQFLQGPHRPVDTEGRHAADVLLEPLQRLAIFDAEAVPRLVPGPMSHTETPGVESLAAWVAGAPTLALHPGSGSESKNWPHSKWRELVRGLAERTNSRLLVVGGESEAGRLTELARAGDPARTRVLRSAPLTDVARVLHGCRGFIGHDSGITHLAAALGLPVTVLWGPSVEAVWRPRGPSVRILRHEAGLEHLPLEMVLATATA